MLLLDDAADSTLAPRGGQMHAAAAVAGWANDSLARCWVDKIGHGFNNKGL